ncbi:LiaI-LiaF-like domain-containing protein [Salsuginibacillus kocurii]|uniref:LiaI-LiaF-like domain-containing protein n=1 Tax=Salsuginibacillus kocurii TaxID=427078 RepID=UPI000362CA1B|nr:DUF5668 domain-containing protein [Salsuginibacillus kocurii]
MKRKGLFPGLLLIGSGLFFLLQTWNAPFADYFLRWPSIFILIGAAFIIQGLKKKQAESLLPGFIFLSYGLHFLLVEMEFWPAHPGMYWLLLGFSFLLTYIVSKKEGLGPGIFLLLVGIALFFGEEVIELFGAYSQYIEQFWPLVFILGGLYFLFVYKK